MRRVVIEKKIQVVGRRRCKEERQKRCGNCKVRTATGLGGQPELVGRDVSGVFNQFESETSLKLRAGRWMR